VTLDLPPATGIHRSSPPDSSPWLVGFRYSFSSDKKPLVPLLSTYCKKCIVTCCLGMSSFSSVLQDSEAGDFPRQLTAQKVRAKKVRAQGARAPLMLLALAVLLTGIPSAQANTMRFCHRPRLRFGGPPGRR